MLDCKHCSHDLILHKFCLGFVEDGLGFIVDVTPVVHEYQCILEVRWEPPEVTGHKPAVTQTCRGCQQCCVPMFHSDQSS